jgi:hypothetical protein
MNGGFSVGGEDAFVESLERSGFGGLSSSCFPLAIFWTEDASDVRGGSFAPFVNLGLFGSSIASVELKPSSCLPLATFWAKGGSDARCASFALFVDFEPFASSIASDRQFELEGLSGLDPESESFCASKGKSTVHPARMSGLNEWR